MTAEVRGVDHDPGRLDVLWTDGRRTRFHPLWLRDNCPSGGDRSRAFRTFSMVDLDPDLRVSSAELRGPELVVDYSDGHRSKFDVAWLAGRRFGRDGRRALPREVCHFRAEVELPTFSLPDPGSARHCDLLEAVNRWGAAMVGDVPEAASATERLASLLGRVRETDFGRLFDIVIEPDAWEFSQTGLALDPHTDDPYRYTPSGASVLHCVEASADGGDSILVDGFGVADGLRADDPLGFELLSTVSVPFVRHRTESVKNGEDVHLVAHAPIIAVDRDGDVSGIRFHERSMGPLDLDPSIMGDYYKVLIEFARRINDSANAVRFRLEPGQAVVYDNQRVLHGRTAFTSSGGRRHLRLCTIDRDQFHSRLRRLREDHGRPLTDERLPAGNLS